MRQFAYIDDGSSVHTVSLDKAAAASEGGARLTWIHLDQKLPDTKDFLTREAQLNDVVVNALTALETRPRCDPMGEGALINLRGQSLQEEPEADELVSIRIWTERGCIISVARYTMRALPALCEAFKSGRVKDPGDFVAILADLITNNLEPEIAELGDSLDECELTLDASKAFALRHDITEARGQAIAYRRFVAPQRQALERLAALECDWLEEDDRLHLREAADRFARMAEELESIRERAALMHEQITDLRAEMTDSRALLISVAALVFLPLTFITGLFGMNVKLPYQEAPWAFDAIMGMSVVVVLAGVAYFMRAHWFR